MHVCFQGLPFSTRQHIVVLYFLFTTFLHLKSVFLAPLRVIGEIIKFWNRELCLLILCFLKLRNFSQGCDYRILIIRDIRKVTRDTWELLQSVFLVIHLLYAKATTFILYINLNWNESPYMIIRTHVNGLLILEIPLLSTCSLPKAIHLLFAPK